VPSDLHPLDRLLRPLDPAPLTEDGAAVRLGVRCRRGEGEPEWLRAGGWRLWARPVRSAAARGRRLERFETSRGPAVEAVLDEEAARVEVPFSLAEAYDAYVTEAWVAGSAGRRLPPAALDLFYTVRRAVPRRLQLAARRALVRRQSRPEFPAWPFDDSVRCLLAFRVRCALAAAGAEELRFRWFWPRPWRAALVLTHDVESEAGLRAAPALADLEEERGLRSSFNVVADWYPVDEGILQELRARGFEIGVHGVHHDRSMFSSRAAFEAQRPEVEAAAARFGADGFRSPATHRVHAWLAELPVRYDCTVPLSDPYEPQPGGCCSPWPYFLGDVVELPWTLPQDHTLFTLLRHRSAELWVRQASELERAGGLIQCLSHPDPAYLAERDQRACYAEFLDAVAERPGLWKALPRDVAAWWRRRDGGEGDAVGVARLDAERGAVELAPAFM
jgi:peptidoglycan/xylan/chitin deacetylase (PgdA/CDA1 family)